MVGAVASTQSGFSPGAVIAEKYRIERKLGEGGMGAVYLAVNTVLEQPVVVKVLLSVRGPSAEETAARFLREARVAAKIQHENVTRVLDFGRLADASPYLVMEYLDGYDLAKRVHEQGPLSVGEAALRVVEALRGLAVIHEAGVVHRDIKPANLFVARRQGGGEILKILDFGVAKSDDENHALTATSDVMGSPMYMSPEQLESAKHVDARTDIWSMGIVLYEILAGCPPFDGAGLGQIIPAIMSKATPSLRARRPDVPPELEAVVVTCLQKDRAHRFPSARALAEALAPFLPVGPPSDPSLRIVPIAPMSAMPRPSTSSMSASSASVHTRGLWWMAALGGVCGVAIVTILVLRSRPPPLPAFDPVAAAPGASSASIEPPPIALVLPSAEPAASPAVIVSAPPPMISVRAPSRPPPPKTPVVSSVTPPPAPAPAPRPKDFEGQK